MRVGLTSVHSDGAGIGSGAGRAWIMGLHEHDVEDREKLGAESEAKHFEAQGLQV